MNKPIFIQNNDKLYISTVKIKPSIYSNYACEFYYTRKKIVQSYLEDALEPLIRKFNIGPLRILDVGCGDGVVLDALANIQTRSNIQFKLYGLDIDQEAIKHVQCKAFISVASSIKMPYHNNFFHLIISSQTIEHLDEHDIRKTLSEIYRVLIPGGIVYIETPNPTSLIAQTMGRNWWMFLREHSTLIPPSILKKMLLKTGFIKSQGKTRAEVDWQINEVREILKGHVPGLKYVPQSRRYFVIKWFIRIFNRGGITVVTARKKS